VHMATLVRQQPDIELALVDQNSNPRVRPRVRGPMRFCSGASRHGRPRGHRSGE
jgi:hypothetical protein